MTSRSSNVQRFSRISRCGTGLALLALAAVACGDDESTGSGGGGGGTSTSAQTTGTGTTTTTGTSGTGTGGAGTGGDSSASAGGGGAGGEGTGGSGGEGGSPPLEPGFAVVDFTMAIDLTSDGRVALFQDGASIVGDLHLYDVATETSELATSLGDALANFATGLSDEGHISALHAVPVQAGLWSEADDWTDLASPFAEACDINVGGAWDVSRDGAVVAGFFWNGCSPQAFLWADSGGEGDLTLLDILGAPFDGQDRPPTNRATVISDDGTVAAGFAENGVLDRTPAVWTADGSGILLDPDNQDAPGEVLSISADGSVVAGIQATDGFRWTEAGGLELLPRLESALPQDKMFVNAMTDDGSLLFGGSGDPFFGVPIAFVWSEEAGTRPLQDVVVAAGIELPEGFILSNVLASSADGSVLIGFGYDVDFMTKSFVVRLPEGALTE